MLILKVCLLFTVLCIIVSEGANILAFYPCPSISHQVVFRPITLELIKRGHHVTVITADPMFPNKDVPANLTEIDVHDISYGIVRKYFTSTVTGKKSDLINQAHTIMDLISMLLEEQFKIKEVQDILKLHHDHYDLLLLESFFSAGVGFTHKFHAPTILVSSFGPFHDNYDVIGAPSHPTIYHDFLRQRLYNLTLWEKFTEVVNKYRIKKIVFDMEEKHHKILQKIFGADIPPLHVLKNNVDMLFVNINPIWEGNYPVPPSVIHMGGLHQKPPKKLPKDLQSFLDVSENGVIYFSFGTNVKPSLLPSEKVDIFIRVFSQLSYNVIWKWDTDNFIINSSNIRIYQWLPQADILRHPNVKVFITQGGLQSTDEAITAGVPLIGIPMLGDQWYNVEKYVHHGIGIRLDFEDLTETRLKEAIVEVAEIDSYRKNIVKLRKQMQDQPQKPIERTIWWIEYVLRHGGAKHLRAPTANISWAEFLETELVMIITIITLITSITAYVTFRFLVRALFSRILLQRLLLRSKLKIN